MNINAGGNVYYISGGLFTVTCIDGICNIDQFIFLNIQSYPNHIKWSEMYFSFIPPRETTWEAFFNFHLDSTLQFSIPVLRFNKERRNILTQFGGDCHNVLSETSNV